MCLAQGSHAPFPGGLARQKSLIETGAGPKGCHEYKNGKGSISGGLHQNGRWSPGHRRRTPMSRNGSELECSQYRLLFRVVSDEQVVTTKQMLQKSKMLSIFCDERHGIFNELIRRLKSVNGFFENSKPCWYSTVMARCFPSYNCDRKTTRFVGKPLS
jgi:hypothetical protein